MVKFDSLDFFFTHDTSKVFLLNSFSLDGPFTLFAPTNEAFQRLDQRQLNNLLDASNQDELRRTLERHVIANEPTMFKRGIKWEEHRTLSDDQIQTQVSIIVLLNVWCKYNSLLITKKSKYN